MTRSPTPPKAGTACRARTLRKCSVEPLWTRKGKAPCKRRKPRRNDRQNALPMPDATPTEKQPVETAVSHSDPALSLWRNSVDKNRILFYTKMAAIFVVTGTRYNRKRWSVRAEGIIYLKIKLIEFSEMQP
ncbi:hypothetical protein NDU88_000579 [Pleurodeles waltl]|uniref:Uncharacterized protein n=1 Tax=Pleurodeles waltl TaxID=8319 RepID=A0AAV7TFZ0_PLEWA|nr:hypothetical protein NDU88_000579 [Pleurodeles waltl]